MYQSGDFISWEGVENLGAMTIKERRSMLPKFGITQKGHPEPGAHFIVQLKCPACGVFHKRELSKTLLLAMLTSVFGKKPRHNSAANRIYCDQCLDEQRNKRNAELKELFDSAKKAKERRLTEYESEKIIQRIESLERTIKELTESTRVDNEKEATK